MQALRKPIILSLACHVILVLVLFFAYFPNNTADTTPDVYGVELVASLPSDRANASQRLPATHDTDGPTSSKSDDVSFGEIMRAQPFSGDSPRPSPSEIAPETQDDSSSDKATECHSVLAQSAIDRGIGQQQGMRGESHSDVSLWKTRVISTVNSYRKSSVDIQNADAGIKLTYRIRIGRMGEILQVDLLESSGDESFDRSVNLALGQVTNFPPPPHMLIAGNEWVEVKLSFAAYPNESGHLIRFQTSAYSD